MQSQVSTLCVCGGGGCEGQMLIRVRRGDNVTMEAETRVDQPKPRNVPSYQALKTQEQTLSRRFSSVSPVQP